MAEGYGIWHALIEMDQSRNNIIGQRSLRVLR